MSKKYVSQALNNNDLLNDLILDGNISSIEYFNYLIEIPLNRKAWINAVNNKEDLLLYVNKHGKNPVWILEDMVDNVITREEYHAYYYDFTVRATRYVENAYIDIPTFKHYFNKSVEVKCATRDDVVMSYYENIALELLKTKKITFEQLKKELKIKKFTSFTTRESYKQLIREAKDDFWGNIEDVEFSGLEQRLITNAKYYRSKKRFQKFNKHFDWLQLSTAHYIPLDFIEENWDKIDMKWYFQTHDGYTTFLLKNKEDLLKAHPNLTLEYVTSRVDGDINIIISRGFQLKSWLIEDLEILVNEGILKIGEDRPTQRLLDLYGNKLYELGWYKK